MSDLQRKKKTRFPISRIKKLMQLNEDIGKTTATVPVVLSKAIELFLEELLNKMMADAHNTNKGNGNKILPNNFKSVISDNNELYGFLKDVGKENKESE